MNTISERDRIKISACNRIYCQYSQRLLHLSKWKIFPLPLHHHFNKKTCFTTPNAEKIYLYINSIFIYICQLKENAKKRKHESSLKPFNKTKTFEEEIKPWSAAFNGRPCFGYGFYDMLCCLHSLFVICILFFFLKKKKQRRWWRWWHLYSEAQHRR